MTSWNTISIDEFDAAPCAHLVLRDSDGKFLPSSPPFADSLERAIRVADFGSGCGQWLDVICSEDATGRVLLLGTGSHAALDSNGWVAIGVQLYDAMVALRLKSVSLRALEFPERRAVLEELLLGALLRSFRLATGRRQLSTEFRSAGDVPRNPTA